MPTRREILVAGAGVALLARRPAWSEPVEVPFDEEMVAHCRSFCRFTSDAVGPVAMRDHVRRCIERSAVYGFTFRGPIRSFIELTFIFGHEFDTDPQFAWAGAALRGSGEQMARAETLYQETLRYQAQVSLMSERAAMTRWLISGIRPVRTDKELLQQMARAFPEKAAYVGDEALLALIAKSPEGPARPLIAAVMFGFGHGCLRDPLLPMLRETLEEARRLGPSRGARHLRSEGLWWLARAVVS